MFDDPHPESNASAQLRQFESYLNSNKQPRSYPKPEAEYQEVLQSPDVLLQKLQSFHFNLGTKFKIPKLGGQPLNLHHLFSEVTARGGIEKVIRDRRWKEVTAAFKFSSSITSASIVLRKYYLSLLYHFEQCYYFRKQAPSPPAAANAGQADYLNAYAIAPANGQAAQHALVNTFASPNKCSGFDMPTMMSNSTLQKNYGNNQVAAKGDSTRRQKIKEQRKSLPIAAVEKLLVEEVRNNDTLIIVGETGSGKTTQLPQYLFYGGFCRDGVIGITQPRRVAAVSVAKRVAEECGVPLGQKVGYAIRFEDVTSASTSMKYMTDGLLLREALLDPYLSKYSVIIVDEAHERTVHTDVLLGLLKSVKEKRSTFASKATNVDIANSKNRPVAEDDAHSPFLKPSNSKRLSPLKLIIMSASLDAQVFSEYFSGARAVHIQGRQYPVEILYTLKPETDYVDAALITIFQIHLEESNGDVLVFLTGQEEIESVERLVNERLRQLPEGNRKLLTFPIFSSLPSEKQMKVFMPAPPGFRKVILATNIAETSVTIPGIRYVIDPGVVKARTYDADMGIESLDIVRTSKAQALQRSGRAGREGPGKCYRLYPESEFGKFEDSTTPEIKRCDLSHVILMLKAMGIIDIAGFDFIEKPNRISVIRSLESLLLLGALKEDGKLADVGQQMAKLPLEPLFSKALILANQFKCLQEMLIVVAMLSVESMFYAPREKLEESKAAVKCFSSPEGDHITLLNVFRASVEFLQKSRQNNNAEKAEKYLRKWCKDNFINSRSLSHAHDVHSQIQRSVEQMGLKITSCGDDMQALLRCLAASFFLNAALKQPDGSYRILSSGLMVQIHPSSVLFRGKPECIIFDKLVRTNNNYIRNICRIDYLWLPELAPHCYGLAE